MRRRIDQRANLAIGLGAASTVALPAVSVLVHLAGPEGWGEVALAAAWGSLALAVLAATGWWIDALRAWWGVDHWVHRFRSVTAWVLPVFNLFTIWDESRILFERSSRRSWARTAWLLTWVVAWLLGSTELLAADLLGSALFAALPTVLVLVSMRSLRAEWHRRDTPERTGGPVQLG